MPFKPPPLGEVPQSGGEGMHPLGEVPQSGGEGMASPSGGGAAERQRGKNTKKMKKIKKNSKKDKKITFFTCLASE